MMDESGPIPRYLSSRFRVKKTCCPPFVGWRKTIATGYVLFAFFSLFKQNSGVFSFVKVM